jgi:hypothetical protein
MRSTVKKAPKENKELIRRVRHFVIEEGDDLFGVASAQVLSAAPEGLRPQDILRRRMW